MPLASPNSLGWLDQSHSAGTQQRPWVSVAKRGQVFELANSFQRESAERHLGVDPQFVGPLDRGQGRGGVLAKRRAKCQYAVGSDLQAGGHGVAAVTQQFVGTSR